MSSRMKLFSNYWQNEIISNELPAEDYNPSKEQDPGNPTGWLGGRIKNLCSQFNLETHLKMSTARMKIISPQTNDFISNE
jgi:hypothetical protein